MTTPGGNFPDDTLGSDLSSLEGRDQASWEAGIAGRVIGTGGGGLGFNGLFGALTSAIFTNVDNDYIEQLPVIQEQQNYIEGLHEAIEKIVLQGQSVYYDGNSRHFISDGVVSVDFIMIGSGGGGGGSSQPGLGASICGYGGGGGGEVHLSVPRSLLGDYVDIKVGAGGSGGQGYEAGYGGTSSKIITEGGEEIAAHGGNGGMSTSGNSGVIAKGGAGMIIGGAGGAPSVNPAGGDSVSQYDLHGGGGGGGSGAVFMGPQGDDWIAAGPGGVGGIFPGGNAGQAGEDASGLAPTGGGGGGGNNRSGNGADGGFPAGGGGGAGNYAGIFGTNGRGGNGAAGRVYVIERMA